MDLYQLCSVIHTDWFDFGVKFFLFPHSNKIKLSFILSTIDSPVSRTETFDSILC